MGDSAADIVPIDQDLPRWTGSTSSIESHNPDRDSPGTPTPNPRRFKDNTRPAKSKAKAREYAVPESPTNSFRSPQKVQSADPHHSATLDSVESSTTDMYDEYNLDGFSKQDLDILLTLAPPDQLPDAFTTKVEADIAHISEKNRRSAAWQAVYRFIYSHPFVQNLHAPHTVSQRRAFERNIYDYTRAQGLERRDALSAQRLARDDLSCSYETSDHSAYSESEIDDTPDILAELAKTTALGRKQVRSQTAVEDDRQHMRRKGNRRKRKSVTGSKTVGEEQTVGTASITGAGQDHSGKGAPAPVNMESHTSQSTEISASTSSVPTTESRNSRRKRKRMDIDAVGETTNQPLRGPKKSKHFQGSAQEQPNTSKSRPTSDSTGETMERDLVHEKDADKPQTTPAMPKDAEKATEKATKKQEKRKRRREKHAAESKEGPHSETKKPSEDKPPGIDLAQLPSAKVIDTKPSKSEISPPPAKKKRNKKKSKGRDSESRVDARASSSRPENQATSKELGPNDPKSEQEAHQNFLRANISDPQGSTLTADKRPRELAEAEGKQSKFIEKLDALKQFSNAKQLQFYDDGKYANADKQTKDDLKDLKEEKITEEEMDIDSPKIDRGPENKEQKKAGRSKTKRGKAAKDEESGGEDRGETGNTKGSSTRTNDLPDMTTGNEDVSVSISGPVSANDSSTKAAKKTCNRTGVHAPSLSLSESNAIPDVDPTQETDQRSTTFVDSSVLIGDSSALLSPPKSPAAYEATYKTGEYQDIVSIPASVSPITPVKLQDAVELMDMQPVCTPSRKPYRRSASKISPFFPKITTSCIPFPPLRAPSFGLIQEKLSDDPYRLLIAVIFLNKTKGQVAVPVFWKVMERYPTPGDLAAAEQVELVEMIGHLGLQNQRAATCINLSKKWIEQVPSKGVRYRRLHYPKKDDGKDIQCNGPPIGDDDTRSAWEIAHLPGIGPYAIDSWRIFCRDKLRGLATGWNGEGAASRGFEPEWRRVLPLDKELRAFLRWMWLRHGWQWDPLTGERTLASDDLILQATRGGTAHERGDGNWVLKPQEEAVEPSLAQVRGDGEEEIQAAQSREECVQGMEICSG